MRNTYLGCIAGALAVVGLVMTGVGWHQYAASGRTTVRDDAPRQSPRTLAPVEKARDDQMQQQLARLTHGNVVLDMRSLESLDGAVTLVEHWREHHPSNEHLVCWLAAADDQNLVTAVRALSETGCSALRVALVAPTASHE